MKQNESGSHAVIAVLAVVVVGIIGTVGWTVYRHHQHASLNIASKNSSATEKSKTNSDAKYAPLAATAITDLQATKPTSTPTTKTTTTPKKNTTTPTPAPPAPTPYGTISFSSDGCMVTATGTPGLTFEAGAFNSSKGGSATYTLPSSGTLTKSSGGGLTTNMHSYGLLTDATGKQIAYAVSPAVITVEGGCGPAG